MVYQKKANRGGKPNQKALGKKPVSIEDMDMFDGDFEDDIDSDDSDEGQQTPARKTPKGKQSMSEKRVSFQVQGKNTPGKTPAKNNSAIKKPATPGKGGLAEFKGMKQNQNKKQNTPQDDDDDDDDEDEDDSDFDADLDLDLGDDDDDEEEDDDDDDDDDEEDDDEEDQKQSKLQKQNNGQAKLKTPMKETDKKKGATTPKVVQTPKAAQTPISVKKEKQEASPKSNVAPLDEIQRRKERELKQLYVGSLPKETTVKELKALTPDILQCIMPRRDNTRFLYAFLQFESEEKAEKNFQILKNKKFKGQPLNLDYVGEKSLNKKNSKEVDKKRYNMKKLFVSGLPDDCTIHQVAKFFPKSCQISFNLSPVFRTANVHFLKEEDCNEAFQSAANIQIDGQEISVLHALMAKPKVRKNKRKNRGGMNEVNNKNHPAKKMKLQPKEEEESSDE